MEMIPVFRNYVVPARILYQDAQDLPEAALLGACGLRRI